MHPSSALSPDVPAAGRPARPRATVALLLVAALLLVGCTTGGDDPETAQAGGRPVIADVEAAPALPDDVEVVPGTREITVTGVGAGTEVHLVAEDGTVLLTGLADELGQLHTAYVPDDYVVLDTAAGNTLPTMDGRVLQPGSYRVAIGPLDAPQVSELVTVLAKDHVPDPELYETQELVAVELPIIGAPHDGVTPSDGFQYLEMRDGTLLSATVSFPDSSLYGPPPYPTIIEMEGYAASNPDDPPPGALIARSFGFATVAVNIRGTGCSGGVFDLFNAAQQADTYDTVEIVARQPWVRHGKVGVTGLSYAGQMTMYTGAMNPPSLAAIAPQSVLPDPWLQQWPGGVYNDGFVRQWVSRRDAASAAGGTSWVSERIDGGDQACEQNLRLRSQNLDFVDFGRLLESRPPDADDRDVRKLASQVEVPTFLTGAFQDEQTGPEFIDLLDRFDNAPLVRVGLWNGRHPDGYSPISIMRWYEFLSLYVAREVPRLEPLIRVGAAPLFASNFGVEDVELEPDRLYERFGDDLDAALDFYESEPPVRVVFESGVGEDELGEPGGTFELLLPSWPPPDAVARTWYLADDGALVDRVPSAQGVDTYEHDPEAGAVTSFVQRDGDDGYRQFDALWTFDWSRFGDGRSLEYLTDEFDQDALLAGPGIVTLHVGASADDAAVQVSLAELRPDGIEYHLGSAWLRLSARAEDPEQRRGLWIGRTFAAEDDEPLPAEEQLVVARLQLPAVGAPVRAGSRLQLRISTPGRDHPLWTFESLHGDGEIPTHRIGRGGDIASSVELQFLPGVAIPPGVPPCPSLRGQPCRQHVAVTNRSEPTGSP